MSPRERWKLCIVQRFLREKSLRNIVTKIWWRRLISSNQPPKPVNISKRALPLNNSMCKQQKWAIMTAPWQHWTTQEENGFKQSQRQWKNRLEEKQQGKTQATFINQTKWEQHSNTQIQTDYVQTHFELFELDAETILYWNILYIHASQTSQRLCYWVSHSRTSSILANARMKQDGDNPKCHYQHNRHKLAPLNEKYRLLT